MSAATITAIASIALWASWLGSMLTRYLLIRSNILDKPGNRSSHSIPVPRGGGIALVAVTLIGWLILGTMGLNHTLEVSVIASMAMLIAIVCWFDDVGNLSVRSRLGAQFLVVGTSVVLIPIDFMWSGLLPHTLELVAAALVWLWFINIFNFMDGIDGITGVETISICTGITFTLGFLGSDADFSYLAIILAASTLGFLIWNWHPAKLFLGDVGSIPLGFLVGWLLIELAAEGQWAAALILPGYYLTDATLALLYRAARLEPVWKAHKQHFYQRAVAGRLTHSQASRAVIITNIWLISCALLSTIIIPVALIGAAFGILALLCYFRLAAQPVAP
jgi:UDP-N-acetylmuramyl pentapeptide phosphotransferase/UDP-N-acetylglucosamine-1-phosphate transferase